MSHAIIDDDTLKAYLAETLPSEGMARVEKALRDSSELKARLEEVRLNRGDVGLHSLGAIWTRSRLSCLTRQQLGGFLLDTLDSDHAAYVTFHIEVIGCVICGANLADLRLKAEQPTPAAKSRQRKIYDSSRGLLSGE